MPASAAGSGPVFHGRNSSAAAELLAVAQRGLVAAAAADAAAERYAAAHLAALRAAAAVLAARARPDGSAGSSRRPRSVWVLVPAVVPELAEWAAFFAAGAAKRAAAEAGLPGVVSRRDADDLLRDAEIFLRLVETLLGSDYQLLLPAMASA